MLYAIEIYIYGWKKHPFTSYPAEKHPKRSNFAITDMRQKPVDIFLLYYTSVGFNFRNKFANLGSFATVSVPLHFIIPVTTLSVI